jgi:hypothetical protein
MSTHKHKNREIKTKKERLDITMNIINQLKDLGLLSNQVPGVMEMTKILKDYVNIDETVQSAGFTGVISVPEINRKIHYVLPLRKTAEPIFCLKYNRN